MPQFSSVVVRVATHKSTGPDVPDRMEQNMSDRPSVEMFGQPSAAGLLTVAPKLVGSPKMKSAFAFVPPTMTAAMKTKIMMFLFSFTWINFQNMIHTSILDFFSACVIDRNTGSDTQTIYPGQVRPVSLMPGGARLVGCFFLLPFRASTQNKSYRNLTLMPSNYLS